MSTAEQIEYEDKVPEQVMAAMLGITYRALQTRRSKGQIPEGVWNKVNGKIIYSRRRYDEWLESLWVCPPGWKSSATLSVSASCGTEQGSAKHSPIPRRKKGFRLHPVLEIR